MNQKLKTLLSNGLSTIGAVTMFIGVFGFVFLLMAFVYASVGKQSDLAIMIWLTETFKLRQAAIALDEFSMTGLLAPLIAGIYAIVLACQTFGAKFWTLKWHYRYAVALLVPSLLLVVETTFFTNMCAVIMKIVLMSPVRFLILKSCPN